MKDVHEYTPENLRAAKYLGYVLDETLRLTPSLYFLPRQGTADVWVETTDGRRLFIPRGVHLLLDVWHANRHEDHWGIARTGHPAMRLHRSAGREMDARADVPKDIMHFGFGFGARICPGQHLGQLEMPWSSARSSSCSRSPRRRPTTKPTQASPPSRRTGRLLN